MINKSKYNKLSKNELEKCRKIFDNIDKNNSGGIDMIEMLDGIKLYSKGITSDDIVDIFKEYDLDSNGEIDFDEFIYIINKFRKKSNIYEDNYRMAIDSYIGLGAENKDSLLDIKVLDEYFEIFELNSNEFIKKIIKLVENKLENKYKEKEDYKIDFESFQIVFFN